MGGAAAHTALKSELSEKFQMLRANNNSSMMRMSGTDLEGLADVLKSEITTSLSALVDTIVTRFVHQRRLFSKQADSVTAAAEQLNKDLLLASQILDRKSPRTKVADRPQNGPTPATQSGNNGSLLLANSQMPSQAPVSSGGSNVALITCSSSYSSSSNNSSSSSSSNSSGSNISSSNSNSSSSNIQQQQQQQHKRDENMRAAAAAATVG